MLQTTLFLTGRPRRLIDGGGECLWIVLCCLTWRHRWATSRQRCLAGWRWSINRPPPLITGSTGRRRSRSTCRTAICIAKDSVYCRPRPSDGVWSKRIARTASRPALTCCRPRTKKGRQTNRPCWKGQSITIILKSTLNKMVHFKNDPP